MNQLGYQGPDDPPARKAKGKPNAVRPPSPAAILLETSSSPSPSRCRDSLPYLTVTRGAGARTPGARATTAGRRADRTWLRSRSHRDCVEADGLTVRRYRANLTTRRLTLPSAASRLGAISIFVRFLGRIMPLRMHADRCSLESRLSTSHVRTTCGTRTPLRWPNMVVSRLFVMPLFSLRERATTYACMLVLPTPAALAVVTHRRASNAVSTAATEWAVNGR